MKVTGETTVVRCDPTLPEKARVRYCNNILNDCFGFSSLMHTQKLTFGL